MFALQRRTHWWMVISCIGSTHLCFDRVKSNLVEETESHVVVFLFLLLDLSGRGSLSCTAGGGSSSSSGTASGGNGADLLLAFGDQFLNVLAGQLSHNLVDLSSVNINSDGLDDLLQVGGIDVFAGQSGEEGSSNVTHY